MFECVDGFGQSKYRRRPHVYESKANHTSSFCNFVAKYVSKSFAPSARRSSRFTHLTFRQHSTISVLSSSDLSSRTPQLPWSTMTVLAGRVAKLESMFPDGRFSTSRMRSRPL